MNRNTYDSDLDRRSLFGGRAYDYRDDADAQESERFTEVLDIPPELRRARWSFGKVIAVVLIGLFAGALFSPLLVHAVGLMRTGMPTGDIVFVSALANLLMLPSFVGAALVRRFGACLLAQAGMAAALAALTPYALDVLLSCFLLGVFTEAGIAFATRYRDFSLKRMAIAGVAVAVPSFAVNVIGHGLALAPVEVALLIAATFGTAVGVALGSVALTRRWASG